MEEEDMEVTKLPKIMENANLVPTNSPTQMRHPANSPTQTEDQPHATKELNNNYLNSLKLEPISPALLPPNKRYVNNMWNVERL